MVVPTYETTAKEQEMIINELRSINRTQENRINIQKEEIKELKNIINEAKEKIHDMWFKIDFANMTSMSWVKIKLDETSQGNELLKLLEKVDE